jgi:hypothetical protein
MRDVLGDALWAAMAAWWIAAVAPAIRLPWRAAVALALCFAVEFSQLVHLPVLDALRLTTVGYLALGSGFDRRDFAAYAGGVLAAVFLERAIERRRTNRSVLVREQSSKHPPGARSTDRLLLCECRSLWSGRTLAPDKRRSV